MHPDGVKSKLGPLGPDSLLFALFFDVIFDLGQLLLVFLMFYTVFRGSGFRVQVI